MSRWWVAPPTDAIDWAEQIAICEKHFPGIEVGHLTLDQLWDKLRQLKRMLGIPDDEKSSAAGEEGTAAVSPDEWFAKAMAGEIEIADIGGAAPQPMSPREIEEQRIRAELSWIGPMKPK